MCLTLVLAGPQFFADADSGNIYAQGVCGLLQCIDAKIGKDKMESPDARAFRTAEHLRWAERIIRWSSMT